MLTANSGASHSPHTWRGNKIRAGRELGRRNCQIAALKAQGGQKTSLPSAQGQPPPTLPAPGNPAPAFIYSLTHALTQQIFIEPLFRQVLEQPASGRCADTPDVPTHSLVKNRRSSDTKRGLRRWGGRLSAGGRGWVSGVRTGPPSPCKTPATVEGPLHRCGLAHSFGRKC